MSKQDNYIDSLLDLYLKKRNNEETLFNFNEALEVCLENGYVYIEEIGTKKVVKDSRNNKSIFMMSKN